MSILPHEAKALLQLFRLQPIIFGWRKNSFSGAFDSWGKIKIHYSTWADQDWIGLLIFKNFADQDWTRNEKFHSPLISAAQCGARQCWTWSVFRIAIQPDSAIQNQCQAKFVTSAKFRTYYCLSVILLLGVKN